MGRGGGGGAGEEVGSEVGVGRGAGVVASLTAHPGIKSSNPSTATKLLWRLIVK